MSDDNKKDKLINEEELADLSSKDQANVNMLNLIGIIIGLSLLMITHNFYSIFKMYTDETVPLVMCPKTFDLDRPVILHTVDDVAKLIPSKEELKKENREKTVKEHNAEVTIDNWIKGFVINYSMKLFPRTPEDAEPFFRYVMNHSTGMLKMKYKARLDDIKKIKSAIEVGTYSKFWIKDQNKIYIRKIKGEAKWKVLIDGFYHKRKTGRIEKYQPQLQLIVSLASPTMTNPEALIVEEIKAPHIVDPISGEKIDVFN